MPITFACDHCGGTLSIAKRKAYSLIDCPKCGCKQVVPSESKSLKQSASLNSNRNGSLQTTTTTNTKGSQKTTSPQALKDLPLFERPDFENLLQPGTKKLTNTVETKQSQIVDAEIVIKTPEVKTIAPAASLASVEILDHSDKIILRRRHLILAAVLIVVLICLTFSVGFLVGRMLK